MATERQISANRRNAQRSTGPKTVEGKLAVGHNALKHGLLSQHALLPEEDASALADLSRRVFDALEPTGEFESLLVDRIVQGVWRLRRLGLVETGLFASAKYDLDAAKATAEAARHTKRTDPMMELLRRADQAEVTITDPPAHTAALERAQQAEALNAGDVPTLGRAFLEMEGTLSSLSRYESNIERGMLKALHELQRLQAARSGQIVPPPMAADVDIALSVGEDTSGDSAKQSQ